jgi:hypothetical protein
MTALEDAQALRKAMKGLGTDEKAIIEIVANRTNAQLLEIKDAYEKNIQRDLIKDLKSEISGNFQKAVLALFEPSLEYDVDQLNNAMKGIVTNEDTLIEIIASRDEARLNQIKMRYKEKYNKDLEHSIDKETKGNFKRLLISLLEGGRSRNMRYDVNDCQAKAKLLYEAGESKWGTSSYVFNQIFSLSSKYELSYICKEYYKLYGHSIVDAINSNFEGDLKKLLKSIIHAIINPSEYFASRINDAIKGLGTKDTLLIRTIVTRREIDLPMIKKYYKQLYGKDMVEDVKKETSGDYRKFLLEILSH